MKNREQSGANMADWLELHGLTAGVCRRLLAAGRRAAPTTFAKPDQVLVDIVPQLLWEDCATALSIRLPPATSAANRVLSKCATNFSPDPVRYPRAFTLHDGGDGEPYVSCPWKGGLLDVLTLAHEFGHALQIVASENRDMAPVARETCAILAESWFISFLQSEKSPLYAALEAAAAQKTGPAFVRRCKALETALLELDLPYDYGWNYPLARSIALLADPQLDQASLWSLFSGTLSLPDLISEIQ